MRISEFLTDNEKLKLAELIFSKVFSELTSNSSNTQSTVTPNLAFPRFNRHVLLSIMNRRNLNEENPLHS